MAVHLAKNPVSGGIPPSDRRRRERAAEYWVLRELIEISCENRFVFIIHKKINKGTEIEMYTLR